MGIGFPVILVHFATASLLLLFNFLSDKIHNYVKQREVLGICVTLVLFDVIWSVGLASTALSHDNGLQMTLQNIFVIASCIQGLEIGFFFCILSNKVRHEFIQLVPCCLKETMPASTQANPTLTRAEQGLALTDDSFTNSEQYTDTTHIPLHRKLSGVSVGSLSPASDSGQNNYSAHFRALDPILEDQT